MIKNNLADIVNVNIEISTPGSSDESFNNILFVVPAPDKNSPTEVIGDKVITILMADELEDYGFSQNHPAYTMALVAFAQSPSPDKVFVMVRQSETEDEETVYEDMATALNRAEEAGGWYGIGLAAEFCNADDVKDTIEWTEAHKKLFGFTFLGNELPVAATNYFRSFAVYGGGVPDVDTVPEENNYINIAMMAKCFGYDPGSETWALKDLAAVYPCKLSSAMKKYCDDNNVTYFTTYANKNITSSKGGKVLGNEWIDVIRFRDWLQNDMQERVFNLLVLNHKVPYTDDGVTGIEGKIEESLKEGQRVGGIAPTEYDADANEIPGYSITVPRSSELTDEQKASRQLKGCKFKAKLAGAIQAVEIGGNLVYA